MRFGCRFSNWPAACGVGIGIGIGSSRFSYWSAACGITRRFPGPRGQLRLPPLSNLNMLNPSTDPALICAMNSSLTQRRIGSSRNAHFHFTFYIFILFYYHTLYSVSNPDIYWVTKSVCQRFFGTRFFQKNKLIETKNIWVPKNLW